MIFLKLRISWINLHLGQSFSTSTVIVMSRYTPVTHVLFDMDGLLLDTEKLYTESIQMLADRFGKTYTWELKTQAMGRPSLDAAKVVVEGLDLPMTPEEYLVETGLIQESLFKNCHKMPGAERLVKHLHDTGVPIAIATSSNSKNFAIKMQSHQEFEKCFHHAVKGSSDPEMKRGKPNPDIFLICASRFDDKPSAEKCLVFEDSPLGVEAGRAAGMQVVMVPDPRVSEELRKDASLVLSSLEDFKPELFGLPPYKS